MLKSKQISIDKKLIKDDKNCMEINESVLDKDLMNE